ncbi:nitroreductase family protein [Candidatus Magnetomonas plexicatena]|uniref:nitroreductase family protein n=1 Tax=Candidatus Magnetomonas plexicatena TaxID=2552947 RepID=UPI001C798B89|nr:nitroreductase family protein [Nitrospirales bacterium LBB_01]
MIEELVKGNRSVRRFYQDVPVAMETLSWAVDISRYTASAANLQPLKYIMSNEAKTNELIFNTLTWAGYLKDWPGPAIGERPAAYIVMLGDTNISRNIICDHGIAAQTILLALREKGFGGCILISIKKEELREMLEIPDTLEIQMVIAIGKPKEQIVVTELDDGASIQYWRDENSVHYVPKRKLNDIIVKKYEK